MSALRAGPDLVARKVAPSGSSAAPSAGCEARVHLAADRAAVRARRCGRPAAARCRARPRRGTRAIASVSQTLMPSCVRHGTRIDGDEQQQLLARVGVVGRRPSPRRTEPGEARQQPAAQRPGRVVLAAERQRRAAAAARSAPARRGGLARAPGFDGVATAAWRLRCDRRSTAGRRRPACDACRARSAVQGMCQCAVAALARKLQRTGHPPETAMMYQAYQAHADLMWPLRDARAGCRCRC